MDAAKKPSGDSPMRAHGPNVGIVEAECGIISTNHWGNNHNQARHFPRLPGHLTGIPHHHQGHHMDE